MIVLHSFGHIDLEPLGDWYNIALTFALVTILSGISPRGMLRRFDKWLGDLSYPVYLLHWQAGAISSHLLFRTTIIHGAGGRGLLVFALALPILLVLCLPQILLIDPFVSRYRDRLRARKSARAFAESVVAHGGEIEVMLR